MDEIFRYTSFSLLHPQLRFAQQNCINEQTQGSSFSEFFFFFFYKFLYVSL